MRTIQVSSFICLSQHLLDFTVSLSLMCHESCVMCHVSCVICHVSCVNQRADSVKITYEKDISRSSPHSGVIDLINLNLRFKLIVNEQPLTLLSFAYHCMVPLKQRLINWNKLMNAWCVSFLSVQEMCKKNYFILNWELFQYIT